MLEIWKNVVGYEEIYKVNDRGEIRSGFTGRILKHQTTGNYPCVYLYNGRGNRLTKSIHRIIAEAFIPNPENLPEVNHIDGNKKNFHITNLEWVSAKDNIKHSFDTGLNKNKGDNYYNTKYTDLQIMRCYEEILNGAAMKEACFNHSISYKCMNAVVRGRSRRHLNIKIENRQNYNRKLKEDDVKYIRDNVSFSTKELSEKLNVTQNVINKIKRGELYKNYGRD